MKKKTILLLESDATSARCMVAVLEQELSARVLVANTPQRAITVADKNKLDAVVCELALPGHSGSEFLYEFRTYADWQTIPCIIYSSRHVPDAILQSRDWRLLNIDACLYKPTDDLAALSSRLSNLLA